MNGRGLIKGKVRAKAVLLRDLGELRSKRLALENPPPPIEEPVEEPPILEPDLSLENGMVDDNQPTPQLDIKDEKQSLDTPEAKATPQDPSKETIPKIPDPSTGIQGPTPPSSEETKPNAANLGINTSIAAANGTPPPGTAGGEESAVDSLFGNLDSANDNSGGDLNFDGMEFLNDTSAHDSQAQNNDFDLDAFGNNAGDFNMTDLHGTNDAGNTNVGDVGTGAQDDLFGTGNNDAADMMDLDLNSLRPAEESLFEDMYFMGDDGGIGGGADMEPREFDDAFFGLS